LVSWPEWDRKNKDNPETLLGTQVAPPVQFVFWKVFIMDLVRGDTMVMVSFCTTARRGEEGLG
jgi:hypothetical protein